jgi:E3 ubiquitin-protein ligase DOA10
MSCRICFESEGTLYHPCKCDGSVKHVHEACLERWIQTRHSTTDQCELCKSPYAFAYDRPLETDFLNPQLRNYLLLNPSWHIASNCILNILLQNSLRANAYSIFIKVHFLYHALYMTGCFLYVRVSVKNIRLYTLHSASGYMPIIVYLHLLLLILIYAQYQSQSYSTMIWTSIVNQCWLGLYPLLHGMILHRMNEERKVRLMNR